MKTLTTLAALALTTVISGCFVPLPVRDHDRREWRDRDDHDRDRDDHDRDRGDLRDRDRNCWQDDGRWVCR